MAEQPQITTLTGTAVAIVSLARFIAAAHPQLTNYLRASLAQAQAAGLQDQDLALLKTVIQATSLTASDEISD